LRANPHALPRAADAERISDRPISIEGEAAIARQGAKDTADTIREAISDLESQVDSITTALFGTEEFARTANIASNLQLRMQKGMSNHMARQLAMFNMPSREDIEALGERLISMDDRLVRIEETLKRMAPAAARSASGPPRTKKPHSKAAKDKAGAPKKKPQKKKPE